MALGRRRILVVLGMLCAFAIGTTAVSLHIRQHLIRVHAQQTLDSIQNLEIGTSRACQVFSEWRKKWRSHVSYEGACDDPNHFYMDFNVQHPAYIWPTCYEWQASRLGFLLVRGICGFYGALSGRTFVVNARVEGVKGVVTRKASQVFIDVPDESPDEDLPATVSATAWTSARIDRRLVGERDYRSDMQQQSLHPGYRVFVGTGRVNADTIPSGGRAFYISAEVGPDSGNVDSERLFRLDLSCLGRWRPCSQGDLMPAAYEQYEIDVRRTQPSQPHQ
jgi:hypothetical protein